MLSSRLFPSYRRYRLFFRRLVKLSEVIGGGGGGSSRQSYSTSVQFGCRGRTGGSSSWGSSSSSSNSSNHHHYHHHYHHNRRLKMGALWSATTASGLLLYSALASGGNSDDEHYRQLLASRSPMLKKAGMLAWEENRITDEELEELLKEFILIETIKEKAATATTTAASPSPSTSTSPSSPSSTLTSTPAEEDNESYCKPEQMETASSSSSTATTTIEENGSFMAVSCLRARATATSDQDWEEVIKQPNFYVWRKAVNNSSLYEYKVFGSFFDISAYAFYAVQRDLEFRKQWDKLVLKLDIVEVEPSSSSSTTTESLDFQEYSHNHQCPKAISSNQAQSGAAVVDDTGNELVHWVMKYPYPMKSREYLFLRRSRVDYARSTIATVSRSVPYPEIPETEEHVRVYDYISQMVIRPHSLSSASDINSSTGDFHALGFDYLLTYFDDTRAAFPSAAYNWMASRGVPDFVEKLHQAALHLTESGSLPPPPPPQNRTSTTTAQLSSSSAFNRDGFSLLYLKSNSSSTSSSSSSSPPPPPPPPRQS